MDSTTKLASLGLTAALALTGCSANGKSSSVSLSARASAETAAAATTPAAAGLKLDDHVTLTRVRIVIRDVKLEAHAAAAAGTTTTTTTSHPDDSAPGGVETETETEHAGEVEVAAGPVLLDLKADALTSAKLQEAVSVTLPDGTYDELRFKIHKLEDGEQSGDADVDAARASIILDGTFDGKDFHFVSQLSAKQKIEGSFTIGGSTPSNITLSIDVTGWFTGVAGALDPSAAANQQAIEENIRSSFRAFEDDDHDGQDDHGEHGGASGSGGTSGGGHDDGPNHT